MIKKNFIIKFINYKMTYLSRPSPPFPAKEYKDRKKRGNNGEWYISKSDKNGVYKWVRWVKVNKKTKKENWSYTVFNEENEEFYIIEKCLKNNCEQITFKEYIDLLSKNDKFCKFFNTILSNSKFKAFLFRCPPIDLNNIKDIGFEFKLIKNTELEKRKANNTPFKNHLNSSKKDYIVFDNLSKDSVLIVPQFKKGEPDDYTHLAKFVRSGLTKQIINYWKGVGQTIKKEISKEKMFINTHGLSVNWLHLRLDKKEKYI